MGHTERPADEKQQARDLGARLQQGDTEALQKLELRVLWATKDNEHFTEWFSEVVRYVMSVEARAKLGPESPVRPPVRSWHHRRV